MPAPAGAGSVAADASLAGLVSYWEADPRLPSAVLRPNPDPRSRLNSPALQVGAAAEPPSDGLLDTSAQYIGASGDSHWPEERMFFGAEADYRVPAAEAGEGGGTRLTLGRILAGADSSRWAMCLAPHTIICRAVRDAGRRISRDFRGFPYDRSRNRNRRRRVVVRTLPWENGENRARDRAVRNTRSRAVPASHAPRPAARAASRTDGRTELPGHPWIAGSIPR